MRKFGINHNVSDKYTLVVKLKNNDAVSKCASLLIEKKDRHFNQHRLRKTSVQAYLSDEEMAIVDRIKEQRKFSSYRELLVNLCQEAEDQAQVFDPVEIKTERKSKPINGQQEAKKHTRHDVDIFQLKITSHSVRPMIWREVLVPASINLDALHQCIMELFGLEGYHLYEFDGVRDSELTLLEAFKHQQTLHYRYDFGDNWEFTLTKQKNVEYDSKKSYPYCLKSKGGMMIEDCGSSYGYKLITDWCRKKTSSTRSALLNYQGDPEILQEFAKFKPDFFDIKEFNEDCTKYNAEGGGEIKEEKKLFTS